MPALEVADIFRRHGEAYRKAHTGHLGRVERRIMGAIEACRTARLGGHVERCTECDFVRIAYNSCRNIQYVRMGWVPSGERRRFLSAICPQL